MPSAFRNTSLNQARLPSLWPLKSRKPVRDSRVAIFYRNFGDLDAIYSRVCLHSSEYTATEIHRLTNLSRADPQWHEHPPRRSMLERRRKWDTGMTTRRERNEVEPWLIIYFCGEHVDDTLGSHRSRGNTARDRVYSYRPTHARYAWNTLKRFVSDIYIEKSELNSEYIYSS